MNKYRHNKPKDLAVVRLGGRDVYLGRYGSEASRQKYRRVVAEWLARGDHAAPAGPAAADRDPLAIDELILRFWTGFAEQHYRRPDGTPAGELDNYRDSLRPLRRLYGATPARDFGPLALKAVRRAMIESGLARTTINQRVGRVVRLFKWGVENELVPPAVYQALAAVRGLARGRSPARETAPVPPAPEADVAAIRPHVAPEVWALVELQLLTGMRPGEACRMRTRDLDATGPIWVYAPAGHKAAHLGRPRAVYLGPRAQAVLRPWLRADREAWLFSPRRAVERRLAERRARRRTPPSPQARRRVRYPGRPPGECYTPRTYHHAVRYGCRRAGVAPWHPHQLRHNAATRLRQQFGLEVARIILGHRSAAVTEIYAEQDRARALDVVAQVG